VREDASEFRWLGCAVVEASFARKEIERTSLVLSCALGVRLEGGNTS